MMMNYLQSSRVQMIIGGTTIIIFLLFLLPGSRQQIISPLGYSNHAGSHGLRDNVYNHTLGFERVFAIALPSRTDQRDALALAGAFTGVKIEVVDGVTEVSDKALPPDAAAAKHLKGVIGAWRAHMNALQKVVDQNISTALIMEGDVDWDVRIKSQLDTFAQASKMLLQPLPGSSNSFLDPTYPRSKPGDKHQDFVLGSREVTEPTTSPYGDVDRWDVLWLGHCGSEFPSPDTEGDIRVPVARIIIPNDETVAEPQHLDKEWGTDDFIKEYDPHTRVVSRLRTTVCSLAYAVTQQGARKLLYEAGLVSFPRAFDLMLRDVCEANNGRTSMATCLSVLPPLFNMHRQRGPKSSLSDINDNTGFNEHAYTVNVRWSTRTNFPKLTIGETDYVDSFPDGHPRPY